MTTSADLGISYLAGQQAQPEIIHNSALNQFQVLLSGVISVGLNTPPGSPTQGDTYILGASPTGAWSGRANCLAGYFGTGWVFVPGNDSAGTPITMGARQEGLRVWNKATDATYVWSGSAWGVVTSGMTNPMTTSQDLIVGGASGTPGRLAVGTNGFVLTVVAGAVAWAAATGFANPMTTSGDIIYGGASGVATRLAAGSNGQVLTLAGGVPSWATAASQKGIASAIASGDYYLNQPIDAAWGIITVTMNTSTTVFCPLILDAQMTVDALALYLAFSDSGKVFDITVYEFLGCGKPGASLASVQGSTTSTGLVAVTLTPVVLPAGVYFIALHTNSTAAYCTAATGDSAGGDLPTMLMLSDGYAKLNGTTESSNYSVLDSALPGGAYTRGMNLTGFTINVANATSMTYARRVLLRKA